MKNIAAPLFILLACSVTNAGAHNKITPTADSSAHMLAEQPAAVTEDGKDADTAANTTDAIAAVDLFTNAIAAGDIEKAGTLLDKNALILESGGAEHDAAEYLSGHAKEDAAFLKTVHVKLVRQTANAAGNMAWVGRETEMHRQKDGKMITLLGTETMVLKRSADGWKIVHIHWSSHTRKE